MTMEALWMREGDQIGELPQQFKSDMLQTGPDLTLRGQTQCQCQSHAEGFTSTTRLSGIPERKK